MNKQIKIKKMAINYTLRTSRKVRNMRLAMYSDGSLVITKPYGVPNILVHYFLRTKVFSFLNKVGYFQKSNKATSSVGTRKHYLKYKEEARDFITKKAEEINHHYQLKYNRISIRNSRTRWGSCSQKGNLNFHYKIIFLSDNLANYIIAHEICHLQEMNHSSRFWSLVEQKFPNYKYLRKQLKNNNVLNFS